MNHYDAGIHVDTNRGGAMESCVLRQLRPGSRRQSPHAGSLGLPVYALVFSLSAQSEILHLDAGGVGGKLLRRMHATVSVSLQRRLCGDDARVAQPMWIDWRS